MGNKAPKVHRISNLEEFKPVPMIVDIEPQPDKISIAIMEQSGGGCVTNIIIDSNVPQDPQLVYDTVDKLLNDSDLAFFMAEKRLTNFRKYKKIIPAVDGGTNVEHLDNIRAIRTDIQMEPGYVYTTPGLRV